MQDQVQSKIPALWGGIECTINRVQDRFFDQLECAGHYNRPGDIAKLAETGIKKLRYPLLWERHQPQQDCVIDWSWAAQQLAEIQRYDIEIIAGLVHHGSGPAFTNLLDDQFPFLLAAYAEKLIQQFPFLTYFTPVNEPLTTARLSGLYGLWYPHQADDSSFLKMLLNQLKGVVLSMQAIRRINPAAKLIQTEDLGKTYSTKLLQYQADFENERRWLTYDLLCGRVNKSHPLWHYLLQNGIAEHDLFFFQENPCEPDVFGFNHYLTSERFLDERLDLYPGHTHGSNGIHQYADVEAVRIETRKETGLSVLLNEAWIRYQRPIAITEVHLHCHREEQLRWFRHVWNTCENLAAKGVQIEGVTAWAMLGSFGWNKLLTSPGGDYEPGVFDVQSGWPRPTALKHHLQNLANPTSHHHLSFEKGWWHRPTRFLHEAALPQNCIKMKHREDSAPILIVGKRGTLGRAFAKICNDRFINHCIVGRDECNICDAASIEKAIEKYKPWAIVNAAGFVRVDDAEHQRQNCFLENATGPHNLAISAARHNIKLVTYSSDLVFDGEKKSAYTEEDKTNPLNTYGLSKRMAEQEVMQAAANALVIRTSAFFGPWDEYNFAHFVRRSLLNEETIPVAKDAVISPTYVPDLVHATLDLLIDDEAGIWHLANQGELTWADFANEVADRFNLNRQYINAIPTEDFRYPAKRPLYSVLTSTRGLMLPPLNDALRRYSDEIKFAAQKEALERQERRA